MGCLHASCNSRESSKSQNSPHTKDMKRILQTISLGAFLIIAGCNGAQDTGTDGFGLDGDTLATDDRATTQQLAVAELEPTQGNEVRGTVTFTQEGNNVRVVAAVTGLQPDASHGFHVHEVGDCSAPDASSAGDHYNPHGSPHGGPDDSVDERHIGDMGNLEADDNGTAEYDRTIDGLTLSGSDSIVGKSVLVHAQEDDLESQPTGDAGARLACGVIQMEGAGTGMGTTTPQQTAPTPQP